MRNMIFHPLLVFLFSIIFILGAVDSAITATQDRAVGSGSDEDPYLVTATQGVIRIDGILDEEAWNQALLLELKFERQPGENVTPPVKTEVFLTYNESTLYAAFRCEDPNPESIQAYLRDRDSLGGDDWVGIILDTFNDQRRSFDFFVSPLGVQYDMVESPSWGDSSWDAIWESAGKITEWGYVVEMAIPFSSLRFQRKDGPQIWGFDAMRCYPRSHDHRIGLFPRDRSNNCYLCQAVKIKGFEGADPGRNIELNPTVTMVRTDARPQFPSGNLEKLDEEADAGITASWGITPNIVASFTANPDFSQVEADSYQLDINRTFALYFPERRPFFTEGADIFESLEDVVYTRTIRDPQWGLKLSGKEGDHTIGAYVVRDETTTLVFPGSQGSSSTSLPLENTSTVFRYKHDIGSRYTLGFFATDREADDYFNRVVGVDLDFRFTRTDQIQLLVLGSSTAYPDSVAQRFNQPQDTLSDRLISFEYDHTSRTWGWWADYEEAGEDFRVDLGYYPMVDYRNIEGGWSYTWNAPEQSWWSLFRVGGEANYFEDGSGQSLLQRGTLWFWYSGAMRSSIFLLARQSQQLYNGRQFDLSYYEASAGFWPAGNLQGGISSLFGNNIDYANTRKGDRISLTPWFNYLLGKHLRLSFNHTFEQMNVDDLRLYTANISQLSAIYQFNVRAFIRAIVQYVDYDYNVENYLSSRDSEYRRYFSQFLFSYEINPRTVLYIGYSDNYYGNQNINLTQADRTFFVKLGYAWVL